jgi:hypothetical protein
VAHGDIGTIGGGANGGTDITGLSRGQEGTTAASWSEGDPVRVGVQGRDDAGPERSYALTQNIVKPRDVDVHDDFERSASDANGYTLRTGQTLTVQQGQAEVQDGELRPSIDDGTRVLVTMPLSSALLTAYFTKRTGFETAFNQAGGVITSYTDNNNYIFVSAHRFEGVFRVGIFEVASGSESILKSTKVAPSSAGYEFIFPVIADNSTSFNGKALANSLSGTTSSATDIGGLDVGFIFDTGNGSHGIKSIAMKLE